MSNHDIFLKSVVRKKYNNIQLECVAAMLMLNMVGV